MSGSAPETLRRREEDEETGIDLRRYLDLLLRHWKLIAATVVVVAGAAMVKTYLTPPVYRAAAIISIEREKLALEDLGIGEGMFTVRDPDFIPTQIRMIQGRDVIEHVVNARLAGKSAGQGPDAEAARELEVSRMIRAISGSLEVTPVAGTSLIEVAYKSGVPKDAAEMANAVVDAFVAWSRESRIEQAT